MTIRASISGKIVSNQSSLNLVASIIAVSKGFRIEKDSETWLLKKPHEKKILRISTSDLQYIQELTANFDFLFDSVGHNNLGDWNIVDFSKKTMHNLVGWSHFEVVFPSFAEPTSTTEQYLEFLNLSSGVNVIDLGAYAGISSIQFQETVGETGLVVSVEADPLNAECTKENLARYDALRGFSPRLIQAACWSSSGFLNFSAEGNVGSAVTEISNRERDKIQVQSVTLNEIMTMTGMADVAAIKADIEGAEAEVFKDVEFFETYHPKIIFEAILKGSRGKRYRQAMSTLETYGYRCEVIEQIGSQQILVGAK